MQRLLLSEIDVGHAATPETAQDEIIAELAPREVGVWCRGKCEVVWSHTYSLFNSRHRGLRLQTQSTQELTTQTLALVVGTLATGRSQPPSDRTLQFRF